MSLVHTDNKIIKLRQNISKRSSQRFLEFMEVELCIRFAVKDFSDVENEKLNIGCLLNDQSHLIKFYRICIIVFPVIYLRSAHFGFKTLEDILRMVRIGFLAELVINGVAWCQDKEMLVSLRFVQIIDAGTHQTGLSNTCCHCIAK